MPAPQAPPLLDLSAESQRHLVIARGTPDLYQGHPTTLLMPDGQTMYCVWCINHGGHCGPMARSRDGGLSWEAVATPADWPQAYNCPSIYRLEDPAGVQRLFVFAARTKNERAMQQSVSQDGGLTWSPFSSLGKPCIMAFTTIIRLDNGTYLGL